jgi:hypothetical protein
MLLLGGRRRTSLAFSGDWECEREVKVVELAVSGSWSEVVTNEVSVE